MSRSTMIELLREGGHGNYTEFGNAWGLGARIWDVLQRHLGWSGADWLLKLNKPEEAKRFWNLYKLQTIPPDERIVLSTTFDKVFVPSEHIKRVAEAFRAFEKWHPPGERVSHLSAAADAMEACDTSKVAGVGFWQTSVAENPWLQYEDEEHAEGPIELDQNSEGVQPISALLPDLFEVVPA